jgi:hypothetical protein
MGCGGGPDKPPEYTVKGTVSYDGKPLESASIVFEPADGKGGPNGGGIQNGAFEFKASAGKKKVRINAVRETDKKDEYGATITEPYIPEKYNANTTLEFEVQPNDENTKEWKLDK